MDLFFQRCWSVIVKSATFILNGWIFPWIIPGLKNLPIDVNLIMTHEIRAKFKKIKIIL